jgi:tol-pal system protein YbgF
MTVTALRVALVAGFVAYSVSPALAQRRELQQMAADIRILQEQTQLLQNALAGLTDALKAVNQRIDEQTGLTRKTFADAKLQGDTMGSDIRVVRERVDDTNVRITSLSQEVESLRDAIAAMPVPTPTTDLGLAGAPGVPGDPSALPPAGGAPPAAGSMPPAAPAPAPAVGANAMSPARLYDLAWADYTAGNYDLAVEGFSSYVRSFPKSESADNAQYYIGESFFQRGKLAEAVEAFGRVISSYPRSDVGGQARYKRGVCYERLNQPDRAREDYDIVIKTLGDTDAGRLAKQRLDALNRARPQ